MAGETKFTVTSSFEILTMLLGRMALQCPWSPGSLGCLTFGWPWQGTHTWGSALISFAPQFGKDPHSELLPGYPWGTDWTRKG